MVIEQVPSRFSTGTTRTLICITGRYMRFVPDLKQLANCLITDN